MLHADRLFSPDPAQREIARALYTQIKDLPLVCPHGHVDPRIFADPAYRFSNPAELLIIPDHYIYRLLYSQGIPLENLGIQRMDGLRDVSRSALISPYPDESFFRRVWQNFAENFYLFRGTPTGIWLADELTNVFNINKKLNADNAQEIYDGIQSRLRSPQFQPRALYEQFNIEVLCTTDAATDKLDSHIAIRESGWSGRILPTFRPDSVVKIDMPGWGENIERLSAISGTTISNYASYLQALENRRAFFKSMGATATDHDAQSALTINLSHQEAESIFQRALRNKPEPGDNQRFTAHMLVEMARMSTEDGLVMQLHSGSYRDHNPLIASRFGRDRGADIPVANEFTRNLKPLLDRFGNHPRLTLILFTLDESTYSSQLAPLAGHYPALRLGPPWWFHDSLNGIHRYFDRVMETAGIYNTVGFNDDTRAFPSIPARHDVWRRAASDWVAGLLVQHIIDEDDAQAMVKALAYDLAKSAYRLE
jgi:glucuronate isomerase